MNAVIALIDYGAGQCSFRRARAAKARRRHQDESRNHAISLAQTPSFFPVSATTPPSFARSTNKIFVPLLLDAIADGRSVSRHLSRPAGTLFFQRRSSCSLRPESYLPGSVRSLPHDRKASTHGLESSCRFQRHFSLARRPHRIRLFLFRAHICRH